LRFLHDRIDYERMQTMPGAEAALKLDRMRELLRALGNPEKGLPIVHVAGTKGKGSTSAAIAAILSAAGFRAGLFTSPHLERLEERMAVDGRRCEDRELVEMVEQIRPTIEEMDRSTASAGRGETGPTYFELTAALALLLFARRKAQAAVLEVGLGGRLDATNVCQPLVCVITNISFDHTQQLGNTLASIAGEKAGIIKPGVPVVSGVVEEEPRDVIRDICRQRGCKLLELGTDFDFDYDPPRHLELEASQGRLDFRQPAIVERSTLKNLALGLIGRHQAENAALALAVVGVLQRAGWDIPERAIRSALAGLIWPARVEVVSRRPAVVLDAAHNPASVAALVRALGDSFSVGRKMLIFGTTRDKDLEGMMRIILDHFNHIALTQYTHNPRAVPPDELQSLAMNISGRRYPTYPDPASAWQAVRESAATDDLICISGSFYLAAEMRPIIGIR
jgi:dihydrofolate synthase / folylpolyglutamate synthase